MVWHLVGRSSEISADHLGCFVVNVDNGNELKVELIGAKLAFEIASENNWKKLWMETDSKPVVLAF